MDRKAFEEEVIASTQGFEDLNGNQKIVHIIEMKLLGIIDERKKISAAAGILNGMEIILKNHSAMPSAHVHVENIEKRRKTLKLCTDLIDKKEKDLGEYLSQDDVRHIADEVFVIMFDAQRKADLFMLTRGEITSENVSNIYNDRMAFEIMQRIHNPGYEAKNTMAKGSFSLLKLDNNDIISFALLSNQLMRSH